MGEIFSNRELSVGIWTFAFILWASISKEVRKSFSKVIEPVLNRKILIIFSSLSIYVSLCVYGLSILGVWNNSQIKNTLIWFLFVGAVALFGVSKIRSKDDYFISSFKEQFKLIIIIEFIIAFHSFSLIFEIIFVPIITLLTAMSILAQYKPEHKQTAAIIDKILAISGVLLLAHSLNVIISNAGGFIQFSTFLDFIVPISLSIMLIPFLYGLSKLFAYESAYVKLHIYSDEAERRRYAKWLSFIEFKANIKEIDEWIKFSCISEFESNESIKKSIAKFKEKYNK